ncbi:UNVERIFIED_CONTAM: hypothetical protein FKN15_026573 [Acipenser sinensis]
MQWNRCSGRGHASMCVDEFLVTALHLNSSLCCRQGPFATFKMMPDRTCEWTGLKFSNDGKLILVSTNGGTLRLLDAFKGVVLHSFMGYNNSKGSEDGKIHVWNAESGMKVAVLDGKHTGPVTCLQFNPKFMTFASGCSNMRRELGDREEKTAGTRSKKTSLEITERRRNGAPDRD